VAVTATPGRTPIHQAMRRKFRPTASIAPHCGSGACRPKATKLRPAAPPLSTPRPPPPAHESPTSGARAWALAHLDRPLPLKALAAHAAMSTRTFTRRFRRETGMSPGAWLAGQRLLRARQLLEQSTLSVDQIADQAGFGTGAALRQHFSRSLGTSPSAYRATFHGGG
ncbi:helix-turn-helix domain-containing protein, partial [Nocardia neocaledoniensis]|uniref:helix-turn-helix domain-containing protein n=1 Tax=Nocardia neocaledoniensis TaxID=236511 RepID=UPI0024541809